MFNASPVGLNAILLQIEEDGSKKPIKYASHSFPSPEQRYSHTECETLEFVWALQYFNVYLLEYISELLT